MLIIQDIYVQYVDLNSSDSYLKRLTDRPFQFLQCQVIDELDFMPLKVQRVIYLYELAILLSQIVYFTLIKHPLSLSKRLGHVIIKCRLCNFCDFVKVILVCRSSARTK